MARGTRKMGNTARRKRNTARKRAARTQASSIPGDVYAIHVAQSEYREAFNTGDVERLLRVFLPEFTDMSEGVPSFYGEDAPQVLRRRMTQFFEKFEVRMGQAVMAVEVLGETAHSYGLRELVLRPKPGGAQKKAKFRFFEVWKKSDPAGWKLEMVIDNEEPLPALADAELPIPWFRCDSQVLPSAALNSGTIA